MEFKLVIAGSRSFNNRKELFDKCDYLLQNKIKQGYDIIIISGHATGADTFGEEYARSRNYKLLIKPADWDNLNAPNAIIKINSKGYKYNARAGMDRNREMALLADACVIFMVGESPGSKGMYNICNNLNVPVHLYKY